MRVEKRIAFGAGLLLLAVSLSACEEGKAIASIMTTENQVMETDYTAADESSDSSGRAEMLQIQNEGGTYRVDSWEIYDNLSRAGISAESLSDYGATLYNKHTNYKFMLVTMERTSTADFEGNVSEQGYVNIFFPVTKSGLGAAYLPEAEEDVISRIQIEHGYEPVYLDQGQVGNSNYFEMDFPAEGNRITYTLGWFLTEDEYQAAINGELYLWYMMDEAQSANDLQSLSLPLDLLS